MHASSAFVVVTIAVLAVLAVLAGLILVKGKRQRVQLRPLAGLAFGFVLAGILFGEDRAIGYALMGVGVILAVADIIIRVRAR